ncbi:hypothetical protein [Apibacter adventoris]|uniref:Uncharacterized protein n=1 Tax=Apibacter adventoris TaxID=1679466 RepID=A0A2S8AAU6_9FLAO|nr:hypothetical protein [Apibacter adventoris]PQL91653.1 hypothetical protein C4S77_07575 [Apibacter adventoris]PQL93704.1 hypothetical protein C4S76_08680 [Apibacter adventoris]
MIYIYLENKPNLLSINKKEALPVLESQAIEIFSKLNSLEDVILGLIKDDIFEFKILPFNRFIWKIEINDLKNEEKKELFFSTQKVINLIHNIFTKTNLFLDI